MLGTGSAAGCRVDADRLVPDTVQESKTNLKIQAEAL